MIAEPIIDNDPLQRLLANAITVQESGMDTPSLLALIDIQRSIMAGEEDLDQAMHRIADCARNVTKADGIAIALLKGGELVYKAGSGRAAALVGRRETAVLSISTRNSAHPEILRVEDAHGDARVEAAICRQFGVRSLLMLPIIRKCEVAAVLEVFFNNAHTFQERELKMYRLMAGLIEDAVVHDGIQPANKDSLLAPPVATSCGTPQIAPEIQTFRDAPTSVPRLAVQPEPRQVCRPSALSPSLYSRTKRALTIVQPVKHGILKAIRWNLVLASIVSALVATSWIAYNHEKGSPRNDLTPQKSNGVGLKARPVAGSSRANDLFTLNGATKGIRSAILPFKRIQIGPNEVDYVSEDVTIRHFLPGRKQQQAEIKEVNIGEDVTVRHFVYKQTRPATATTQLSERPLAISK